MTSSVLPAGYHYTASKEDCWICLDTMEGGDDIEACDTVIAHDGGYGDAHPAHKPCMVALRKHFKICSVCQEPLERLTPPTYWEHKLEQMSAIYSRTSRAIWVGANRLEQVNGIFIAAIGAGIALASDTQALTSREIAIGGMWGLVSSLTSSLGGFRDIAFLLMGQREEAHERILFGVALGSSGGTKTGRAFFAGMLTTATVVSLGGGPVLAFAAGALTGTALEQTQKISKLFNPSRLNFLERD